VVGTIQICNSSGEIKLTGYKEEGRGGTVLLWVGFGIWFWRDTRRWFEREMDDGERRDWVEYE